MPCIYLHGFASSPNSRKARYLCDRLRTLGIEAIVPDLNQGDFTHLTLTRQLEQVSALMCSLPDSPILLFGSSFGGLTAAWLAQQHARIERLILLAPAFDFLQHFSSWLDAEQLQRWQATGTIAVHHYGEGRSLPLHFGFIQDLQLYDERKLTRSLPTLILHGRHDDTIPLQSSRDYIGTHPEEAHLIELDSDHALGDVLPEVWEAISGFLNTPQNGNRSG
ncbi:putative esterase [Rubidibacter lacunae KORDI 51-2]|uniref:Putative esterase n=2 Tax=Rubidibacter TaxID=582491 RepID=U5DDS4_9CHRO|nr:putative esterase [Rubidibacter lacunae KORDI 51-2]